MAEKRKKLFGSVAVDSQTGMAHYNTPKNQPNKPASFTDDLKKSLNKVDPTSGENDTSPGHQAPSNPEQLKPVKPAQQTSSNAKMRPDYMTPNYGEHNDSDEVNNPAGVSKEFLDMFEHDSSEVILYQATRHPIGVFTIFGSAVLATFILVLFYLFLVSDSASLGTGGLGSSLAIGTIGALVLVVLVAIIAGIALVAAHVYKKSRMILTNQKVVLIQYHSLISREVSQLNINEVEDVNVSQPSIFDRIFKTGRITIETAGEQNNYVLTQIENPYEFAKKTIQMHEGSIAEYGN